MRYPAAEKLEIIRLVEQSALPVRRTLEKIGIPPATFYRWYDLYRTSGPEALDDRHPRPDRVWNRIPDNVRQRIVDLALDEPALSPRELAVRFTDAEGYFVSEASVYRLLKAHDLIASPAFIVMKAADEFSDKTTPGLYFGSTKVNNDFTIVDKVKAEAGGTATLFVKSGDDYVRVSTNVPGSVQGRALGTILDPKGKAIVNINKGEAFYGEVDILGKPYVTGYDPIKDASGKVIGIWYVGYEK